MVPCTCVQPASTATSVLATAQPESLCVWMPERCVHPRLHVGDDARDVARQHAAVRVAQHDRVSSGLGRSDAHGDRVVGVGVVAVEEVLGVEEDDAVLALQIGDRVARHLDALVERRAERLGDLQVPALARRCTAPCSPCRAAPSDPDRPPPQRPLRRVEPNAEMTACSSLQSRVRARRTRCLWGWSPGNPPSM